MTATPMKGQGEAFRLHGNRSAKSKYRLRHHGARAMPPAAGLSTAGKCGWYFLRIETVTLAGILAAKSDEGTPMVFDTNLLAKILLSLASIGYGFLTIKADFNTTHATNPLWT